MARALIGQASRDYLGMADALGPWPDDATVDGRSRGRAALWRPARRAAEQQTVLALTSRETEVAHLVVD